MQTYIFYDFNFDVIESKVEILSCSYVYLKYTICSFFKITETIRVSKW